MMHFAAIYAFWKTSKRCPVNILIKFRLKCLLPRAAKSCYYVTGAGINSARAVLEFLRKERYRSIRFEVKYSSLPSKNRRIDLLFIEFARLHESLPEYCISDSYDRRFRSMLSIISRWISILSSSTFHSIFPNAFITFVLKNMNDGRNLKYQMNFRNVRSSYFLDIFHENFIKGYTYNSISFNLIKIKHIINVHICPTRSLNENCLKFQN